MPNQLQLSNTSQLSSLTRRSLYKMKIYGSLLLCFTRFLRIAQTRALKYFNDFRKYIRNFSSLKFSWPSQLTKTGDYTLVLSFGMALAGEGQVFTVGSIGKHSVVATKLSRIGQEADTNTATRSTVTRMLGQC